MWQKARVLPSPNDSHGGRELWVTGRPYIEHRPTFDPERGGSTRPPLPGFRSNITNAGWAVIFDSIDVELLPEFCEQPEAIEFSDWIKKRP